MITKTRGEWVLKEHAYTTWPRFLAELLFMAERPANRGERRKRARAFNHARSKQRQAQGRLHIGRITHGKAPARDGAWEKSKLMRRRAVLILKELETA